MELPTGLTVFDSLQKLADEQRNLCFDLVERRSLRIWTKSANPETAQILMAIHAVFRKASGQPEWSPERKDDHLWTDCKFTQVGQVLSQDPLQRSAHTLTYTHMTHVHFLGTHTDMYIRTDTSTECTVTLRNRQCTRTHTFTQVHTRHIQPRFVSFLFRKDRWHT